MADDAPPWHDATHIRHEPLSPGALRRWVREILECWFDGRPIREEYLIVDGGQLAGAGAHAYSAGNATGGADEAVRFKEG